MAMFFMEEHLIELNQHTVTAWDNEIKKYLNQKQLLTNAWKAMRAAIANHATALGMPNYTATPSTDDSLSLTLPNTKLRIHFQQLKDSASVKYLKEDDALLAEFSIKIANNKVSADFLPFADLKASDIETPADIEAVHKWIIFNVIKHL